MDSAQPVFDETAPDASVTVGDDAHRRRQ